MNKDKVYVQGYVVGFSADAMGYKVLRIQLPNMDIVEIDENLVYRNIDEQQKPVVPQFAAEFIAEQKKQVYTLSESIDACMSDRVAEWYWDNSELFVRAWLDGYTVEKEKRYLVKMKGVVPNTEILKHDTFLDKWYTGMFNESKDVNLYHTRKQLEDAGFGWVFDCPGVEVEEV